MSHFELLVGTRKGLVIGRSEDRRHWEFGDTLFPGWYVDYAVRDPRSGRLWAAVTHEQWGPHLHCSDDSGETWDEATAPSFEGTSADATLARIWTVQPGLETQPERLYAGVDPAALFISDDAGASWRLVEPLWNHETKDYWEEGAAGMTMHHIALDPGDPDHLYVAISAAGVFETTDGGETWAARNRGFVADHLPDGGAGMPAGFCVHSMFLHPLRPNRLFQQHHPGVYRSDDGAGNWINIEAGLPGRFGFASTIDPTDPDAFFVVPLAEDQTRFPIDGALRVFQTRDAGETWRALGEGLPADHVQQGVYRQALTSDGHDTLGLYLGTSGGHVYGSADGGEHWTELLDHLAPVLVVRCSVVA